MSWKTGALAMFAALLLLPAATASTVTVDTADPILIAPDGSASIPFTATVDCIEFLEGATTSITDTITSPDAPAWLTVTPTDVTFDGTACLTGLPSTSLSVGGTLPVAASASAPGMTPTDITVSGASGGSAATVMVDYAPGYEFKTDQTFPMEVPSDGTSFEAMIHLYGNARSMAMFEVLDGGECVNVSGIPDFYTAQDAEVAGDLESMVPVTITVSACSGEWTESKFEFRTWSHFLDDGAMKTDDQIVTWNFIPAADSSSESEDSPAGFAVAGLALLGAALVAARRRD